MRIKASSMVGRPISRLRLPVRRNIQQMNYQNKWKQLQLTSSKKTSKRSRTSRWTRKKRRSSRSNRLLKRHPSQCREPLELKYLLLQKLMADIQHGDFERRRLHLSLRSR